MEETFEAGGYKLEDRGARWIEAYVRLQARGDSLAGTAGDLGCGAAVGNRLSATNRGRGIQLWPLWQTPFNNAE